MLRAKHSLPLPGRCLKVLLRLASCASAEHALDLWPMQDCETSLSTASIERTAACVLQVRQHPKLLRQVLGAGQAGGRHSEGALLRQRKRCALVMMGVSRTACLLRGASRQHPLCLRVPVRQPDDAACDRQLGVMWYALPDSWDLMSKSASA